MKSILMISSNPDAVSCAEFLSKKLGTPLELAVSRRAALAVLRRSEFQMVMVDVQIIADKPEIADVFWQNMHMAMPLLFQMPVSDCTHLLREIKAGFGRREREFALAKRSVKVAIEGEFRSSVTGILVESQLALDDPGLSSVIRNRLQHLLELAGGMQQMLRVENAN